jgi:hypothetical protein
MKNRSATIIALKAYAATQEIDYPVKLLETASEVLSLFILNLDESDAEVNSFDFLILDFAIIQVMQ